jgi:hypothetical protein
LSCKTDERGCCRFASAWLLLLCLRIVTAQVWRQV